MINNILSQASKVKKAGHNKQGHPKWLCCCPAHEDKSASLMISDSGEKISFHCFASCDIDSICLGFGLQTKDLYYMKKPQIERDRYAYKELQKEYKKVCNLLEMYGDIVGTPEFTPENMAKMAGHIDKRAELINKMNYLRERNT